MQKKTTYTLIIFIIIAYGIAHFFFQYKSFATAEEIESYYKHTEDNKLRIKEYQRLFEINNNEIDVIYGYIKTLLGTNYSKSNTRLANQLLRIFKERYNKNNADSVAIFALGTYYLNAKNHQKSEFYFKKISNKAFKYLNMMQGINAEEDDDFYKAETFYLKEINNNGELEKTYFLLANLYDSHGDEEKLENLYSDFRAIYHLSEKQISSDYLYSHAQYIHLYIATIIRTFSRTDFFGILGAILIACLWIYYLLRLDLYEPEKKFNIILCFVMGFLCAGLVVFYHFYWRNNVSLHKVEDGSFLNNLLYYTFAVGAIEELVKFLPFFYFFYIARSINESFDFILYPSIAALGFACIENVLYFDYSSDKTMLLRALFCCSGHGFYSSIIGYGCMKSYLADGSLSFKILLKYFALACFFHGLYDAAISSFDSLWIGAFFWFGEIGAWLYLINIGLKESKFYTPNKAHDTQHLQNLLFLGFGCILIYEVLVNAYNFGANFRETDLIKSTLPKFIMCLAVSYLLGLIMPQKIESKA